MRLGPVPAGPVHSCVGAAGRFAAVCCVRGEGVPRDKIIIIPIMIIVTNFAWSSLGSSFTSPYPYVCIMVMYSSVCVSGVLVRVDENEQALV